MIPAIRLEVDAAIRSFRFHEHELISMLEGPDGPVARDIASRAIRVESAAKMNATGPPGPNVRTGRLRSSITWRLGKDDQGVYADVGSSVLYAPYVELGTSRMAARPFLVPALAAARSAT